jgi:hypothetical protein
VADKCKPYTLFKGYLLKSSVRCNPLVAIVFRCVAASCTHVLLCGNNLLCAQVHTVAMKPILASFTLNHEIVRIVGKPACTIYCNSVWSEISSGSLVLKAAEEILSSDSLQLDVVAEGVHSAGAFNGISTLNVIVVREEELSGTMEWSPSTLGLFRSIVPAHTQLDVIPAVCFNLLYLGYIGRLLTILCAHQDSVTHSDAFVCSFHQK